MCLLLDVRLNFKGLKEIRVANPDQDQAFRLNADPDPAFHFNAEPDPAPH
jgi:hypothetical protein